MLDKFLLSTFLLAPLAHAADAPIALYYHERPPFMVTGPKGAVSGLTADAAAAAFREAGIAFVWKALPTSRVLFMLRENPAPGCAVGFFRTPEREGWAKFSRAIYRDRPTVIVAHPRFRADGVGLAELLENPGNRILLKQGASYGPQLDGMLERAKAQRSTTTGENTQMLNMVKAGRADFIFLPEEEAEYFIAHAGFSRADFQLLRPADLPRGEERFLMCSRGVPDALMQRLNMAIQKR